MKYPRIQINALLVYMAVGAMGPPLLGPVREALQASAGLSRAELGRWVFWLGLAGSTVGLGLGVLMGRTLRTTFMRSGTAVLCLACVLMAVARPEPGLPVLLLGLSWFIITVGRPMVASSNGIFADLWESSPRTGVIVLHATNSVGKVLGPVAVLVLGTVLARTAVVYAAAFGLLAVESLFWPRRGVRHLAEVERAADAHARFRLPKDPGVWLCTVQFGFIAGAEGGATAILGSLMEKLRPVPVTWVSAEKWPAAVISLMLCGIVFGRIVFAALSVRMRESRIIAVCLACGLFAVPGGFSTQAWVYLPCLFLTGVCFSATWPAFFALAARAYPSERTFLSFSGAFFNSLGIAACIYLASAVGNADARLPHAFVVAVAIMGIFAAYIYLTPHGRRLAAGSIGTGPMEEADAP